MCGRFAQYRTAIEYLEALRIEAPVAGGINPEPIARYNVAPRTRVLLLHQDDDGIRMSPVPWGYAPSWAQGPRPPAINARAETVATGRYWRGAWRDGRALVPADGWYEWQHDAAERKKRPFFFRLKGGEPLFFAAIGHFPKGGGALCAGDGFAIITTVSDGEMIEIHDRMPLVLAPDQARAWIQLGQSPERAEEIALQHGLTASAFEWFLVGAAVGNVRSEGAELLIPITAANGSIKADSTTRDTTSFEKENGNG